MIVWGGNGIGFVNARYNPTTDSWTATSTTNAPAAGLVTPQCGQAVEMIVWGGLNTRLFEHRREI